VFVTMQILSKRVVTRLRALIVLPTRDLVLQVREVFEQFCRGTGLKVGRGLVANFLHNSDDAVPRSARRPVSTPLRTSNPCSSKISIPSKGNSCFAREGRKLTDCKQPPRRF